MLVRVDLDVEPGGAMMLLGHNGSGKTTLLRCLATSLCPHHGEVTVGGLPLWEGRDQIRERVALLGHATALYEDLSASDNLLTWARLGGYRPDIPALLRDVGIDPARSEPVRMFSAGMRRRVALARILMKRPKVLLLDEPFTALDPEGRDWLVDRLRALRGQGTTVVIATHLPEVTARVADQAVLLVDGRVTWRGSAEEAASRRLGGAEDGA